MLCGWHPMFTGTHQHAQRKKITEYLGRKVRLGVVQRGRTLAQENVLVRDYRPNRAHGYQ